MQEKLEVCSGFYLKGLRWMGDVKAVTAIVPLSLTALPHRKPVSSGTSVTAAMLSDMTNGAP
jgi:hypothetical protein